MKKYIIIEKDILFHKMSIVEKIVKKHGIIVSDENRFLKLILKQKKPDQKTGLNPTS